jgi:DNA-binding CsgD family transcriptional regulator
MHRSPVTNAEDINGDEFRFNPPRLDLFDKKHWSYIQRYYHMSPRELQVAELICKGFDNDEIGKTLKIKAGTVKTHIRNIYRRIRVKNRIAMLLKFASCASEVSAKSRITPPIVGTKNRVKKALPRLEYTKT